MDTKTTLRIAVAAMGVATALAQPEPATSQETLTNRILSMSDGDQVAYVNSDLNQGMPIDKYGPLRMLVLNRSTLVLPIIEQKIEDVLRSASPIECFADKTVDPQKFVDLAAWTLPEAGDEQALRQVGKLIAIDEKRFGTLVGNTMAAAQNRRNPFAVAYSGFAIRDPKLDRRILAWIEPQFGNRTEFRQTQLKNWWGEAMAETYGRIPTEANWADDPIASRINPELSASLHDEILRLAADAFERRSKK
jgi:hypothetical protein